jgi:predicted Zn-dependent protease
MLDGVLAAHPGDFLALRTRGDVELNKAGQAAAAERWLGRAAAVRPNDYQTQVWLREALVQQGKTKEAAAQKVVVETLKDRLARLSEITSTEMSVHPHDKALACELGTLLVQLGYDDMGKTWLQTALLEDPQYRPAHLALAAFYEAHHDPELADEHRLQAAASPEPPPPRRPKKTETRKGS